MLGFGALGEFPLADFDTPNPPVSIGLPVAALSLSLVDGATLRAGKNFDAPPFALSFATLTPTLRPGKNVNAPPVAIVLGAPTPKVLPGKLVGLPPISLSFDAFLPNIQTGRVVNLANTFVSTTDIGCLGEGALGEYVMGNGAPVPTTFTRPIHIAIGIPSPKLRAGKNFAAPVVSIAFHAPLPEADARSRRIRINAIAS